jgi:DNA-binding CsgD family transcriptional regulator
MNLAGEIQDPEAALLALAAAGAAYFVARDWRVMLIAGIGTLAVRVGAGLLLHGTREIPDDPLPGLTDKESAVARLIHAGYGDPAIAVRLGISLKRIEGRVQRIQDKWHVSTRKEIAQHLAEILGEPPEHPTTRFKQRWELIAEVGTGVAVMALGLGILTLPPETPLIGDWRGWIGLSLLAAGLLFSVVSTAMYVSEQMHRN